MNDISEALSLQPDPSFSQNSQTGPGIIVEGGEAEEVGVQAGKHHVEAKGTNAGPNRLGPGKIQSCDWSISLKNVPKFPEVQFNEKLIKTVQ